MSDQVLNDPREAGPKPPFPKQEQEPVGLESEMDPKPDYGYETYKGYGRLEGRAAVVTGGDSGIGRAVALAFAREGADVLVSYLDEHPDAEETVRVVEEAGRKGVSVAGDIGDPAHCKAIVDRAVEEFGRLDILVNNAAYQMEYDSITDIPPEEIELVFKTNVLSQFYLCQAAVPHLKPGASIINTTSVQADNPSPELIAYAATKGAIQNFTASLAQMLAERGIRANGVAPGPIWTPLIPSTMPEEKVKSFGQQVPMKRPGQPVELAPVYVMLATDEASYVSGATIAVTGGMSSGRTRSPSHPV